MRSLKFLAALAIPAMFAACAKEELYDNYVDNTLQQVEGVVGADLIGTDVSMEVVSDIQTKVTWADGKWDKNDQLGLGWIINGNSPSTSQALDKAPSKNTLWANHLFNFDEETGEFISKGNMYQGWYFGYYPWGYESEIGPKTFTVNPTQKGAKDGKSVRDMRAGQMFRLSNLQFLTNVDHKDSEGNVIYEANVENDEINASFTAFPVVAPIVLETNPAENSAFAANGTLSNLKVTSVKIDVNQKVFADKVVVNAQNIPVWNHELDAAANQEALYAALYNGRKPIFALPAGVTERSTSVVTTIEDDACLVSNENNALITIVTPFNAEITPSEVQIDIVAGSGTFEIRYVTPSEGEELSDAQEVNNAAIEALVAAYLTTEEKVGDIEGTGKLTDPVGVKLSVVLNPEDFTTEDQFNNIENHDQWVAAVDLVTKLQLKNPKFRITGPIDFVNSIEMPENANLVSLLVEKESLDNDPFNIKGNVDGWPEKLSSAGIRVNIAEDAKVTNAHKILAYRIFNDGTLEVPAPSVADGSVKNILDIPTNTTLKVQNNETGIIKLMGAYTGVDAVSNLGEIIVEYGATITPATNNSQTVPGGKITYVAQKVDETQPERIIRLIATADQDQYAYVNNIVVGTGIELDLTKSVTTGNTSGSNDIYAPEDPNEGTTTTSSVYGDLSGVDFSINGGTVKSTYLVSDVAPAVRNVTMNGGNVGPNVDITGKLAIEDGVNVVKAAAISAGVEVKAGSGVIDAKTITGGVTIESGNYTVIATAISGNVVAEGENYFTEVGAISGDLTLTNTTSRGCSLNGIAITGKTTLNGNFDLVNVTAANVEIKAGTVKLANNTITGTLTIGKDATVVIIGENDEFGAIVNNGKLTSFVDLYVEDVTLNAKSETVLTSNGEDWDRTIWYTGTYTHTNMTLKGTVEHANAALLMADLENALVAAASGEEATVTLKSDVVLTEPMILEPIATRTATPEVLKITVDLNGFDITAPLFAENQGVISEGNTDSYAFWVKEGVELTINGSGKVITQSADYGMCVWADGGKVIINGGVFYSPGRDNNCCDCIYAKNGGEVVINNGIFSHGGTNHPDGGGAVVNVHNTLVGKITVNGGTFRGDRIYEQGDIEAGTLIWNIQSEDVE